VKAVDTNVLIRYIVRDDDGQAAVAARFLQERTPDDPAYVSLIVLTELVWTLRSRYRYPNEQILLLLTSLLETAELAFEDEAFLSANFASDQMPQGDIADHLIARCARRAGCETVVTFDQKAAKSVPGMELLS